LDSERYRHKQITRAGPRFRVEAKLVHDLALSESGLLSAKIVWTQRISYQPGRVGNPVKQRINGWRGEGAIATVRAIYT